MNSSPAGFLAEEPEGPCWSVTIRDYGDGRRDLVALRQDEPRRSLGRRPQRRELTDADVAERHKRFDRTISVRRSKRLCRQRVMMLGADRMLSLTFRRHVSDLSTAWGYFRRWERAVKAHWPKFEYVAVPELQKRGVWHFHLAVKGFWNVNVLRFFWWGVVGRGDGNVDITSPRSGAQWKRENIARYLTKYMLKDAGRVDYGRRRYSSSKGIESPTLTRCWLPLGDHFFRLLALVETCARPVLYRWEHYGGERGMVYLQTY